MLRNSSSPRARKKANFLHGRVFWRRRLVLYDSTDFLELGARAFKVPGFGELVLLEGDVSPEALLTHLLELEGVVDAALLDGEGQPLVPLAPTQPFASSAEALATCLTSDRVLAELLGAEAPTQTVLEFGSETVLFTLSVELSGNLCRVVALCLTPDLSRVRFGLRRLLPQVASAVSAA